MTKLTEAIMEDLRGKLSIDLRTIRRRSQVSDESYVRATARSLNTLRSIEFFSPEDYIYHSQEYNSSQLKVMSPKELSSSYLERIVSPEKINLLDDRNKVRLLAMMIDEIYLFVSDKKEDTVQEEDILFLKLIQAIHLLKPEIAETYGEAYNRLADLRGNRKKILKIPIDLGYGLCLK